MKKLFFPLMVICSLSTFAQQPKKQSSTLETLQKEKNVSVLQKKIKNLENGTAEDLDILIQYYNKNAAKKEKITQILLTRFPNSMNAKMTRLKSFLDLSEATEAEALLQKMITKYPEANLDMEKNLVACAYAEIPDIEKTKSLIATIEDPIFRFRAIIQTADIVSAFDTPKALLLIESELQNVEQIKDQTTKSQPLQLDPQSAYYDYMNSYGKLLFKQGNYEKAYPYTQKAYKNVEEKDSELIENYAFLSSLNGNYEEALPILVNAVKEGKNDDSYLEQVRKGYAALNPGKDVDAYMNDLKQEFIDKIKADVSKLLIDKPAPNFSVTDINGKKVLLADFKGKTIVLDFWATWCGPCVESFPAMQIAVNHYKDDPQVKFLFIHTWENSGSPLDDARNFLNKRNYNFDLYIDPRNASSRRSAAADAFKIDGIPAKFIIDENSRIRFNIEGFSGKAEAAAEELVQMVEMARQKK